MKEKERHKLVITIAQAKKYLEGLDEKLAELGLKKRTIKRARVERMKRKIVTGKFRYGISNISLATNGAVLNGTHTLTALSELDELEGKPGAPTITIDVYTNCPKEDFGTFDEQGSSRNLKEVFEIQGEENPAELAVLVPRVKAFLDGTLSTFQVGKMPTEELQDTLEDHHSDIYEATEFSLGADYRDGVVALMYFAASRAGELTPRVRSFLKGVKDGANLPEGSLALRLRSYIDTEGRNLREKTCIKVFFRAINSVISGEPIKHFGRVSNTPLRIVTTDEIKANKLPKKARAAKAGA